jgi:uncharacterized protein (DUF983 family)
MSSSDHSVSAWGGAALAPTKRPVFRSLWRGFLCRCPNCGEGPLMRGYLKPLPSCSVCGEDLSHQRSDDAPPYFTIVVVGHIVVPLMLVVGLTSHLSNTAQLALWLPLTAALTLGLLRPIKGATIALQWALRMHGFDGSADPDAMPEMFRPAASGQPPAT